MSLALAVIGLPLVLVVPGLCTLSALAPLRRLDWPERIYLSLSISLILSGWWGLVLAQIGCFSVGLLLLLPALYSLALGLWAWRKGRWRWPRPEGGPERPWAWAAWALISIVFIVLAFRPFELILGPRDAAVYPATAAQIVHHGGILVEDPLLRTLSRSTPEETHRTWVQFLGVQHPGRFYYHYLRLPGFFIADEERGLVLPQFYHLYPTWLAIAFSLVGIPAGLWMTPYLSFLGGLGLFFLGRRLLGMRVALLSYLFLSLQTLQVWFARYSTAEGATQFLIFLGLYGLLRLEEDGAEGAGRDPFFGWLSGLALGMIGLVRVDFIFPWLLLLPYWAYLFVARTFRPGHRRMLLAWSLPALHTLAQLMTHTRGYTIAIYYHRIQDWATLSWLIYPFLTPTLREYFGASETPRTPVMKEPGRPAAELGAVTLAVGLLLFLRWSPRLVERLGAGLRRHRRLLLAGAAVLFLLAFCYLYFVRPQVLTPEVLLHPLENRLVLEGYIGAPVPEGSAANMVRLGWYFSPPGMLLAALGIAALLWEETSRRSWYLLALGLFYLVFFNYEVFGEPHHIYIMRRYVPVVVPFFSLAMAYALERLAGWRWLRRAGPALAGILAFLMAVYLVYSGLPFYRHNEYEGALEQVGALAERFAPEDVLLLIDGARDAPATIATPLKYLFERNAFVLMPDEPDGARIEEQVRLWESEGRRVYLLIGNDGGRLFLPHTRLRYLERFELAVPEFEQLTAQKPHNAYTLRQPFGLYVPEAWDGEGSLLGNLPLEVDLGSGGYIYQAGGFYGDEVAPDGTTYCWTGGRGLLRLPWPEEGEVRLTLRLAGGKRPAEIGPAQVEVWLGERLVGKWALEEAFNTYTVTLSAQEVTPEMGRTVLLALVSPTWAQADYGLGNDRRPLGVQVDGVRVDRGR
ncbi:MAG: hypothetical protein ACP5OO_05425 [Chloroflexia bacterium]